MLVNGKVWPFLDVEPRMYRFRILNGCNARIMSLRFGGLPMWQIGAEGGLFDRPVRVRQIVLAPAERADILVDFRGLDGRTLELRNSMPAPPVSTPAPPLTAVHAAPRRHPRHPPRPALDPVEPARAAGQAAQSGPDPVHHAQRGRRRDRRLAPEPERPGLRRDRRSRRPRGSARWRTGSGST